MKCPKCQCENKADAIFCMECGEELEVSCPNCGRALSPRAKYCDACRHDLRKTTQAAPKDLSFDEKIAKIQRYLPEGLTEKILSQRDRIEGERKQVTVMFCDMEGFTALTERLGPEEAYGIMDQVYEILIHKVHDYEGTVNEMTGDGIVALFGAPIALEDAPQRAIRSAMAIHREMVKFSERISGDKAGIPTLKMRIGIHSGPVVVGTLGNDLRVDFKAVGDTVNLACRMEQSAKPGTVYVTEETFKLTEGLFRFEALGAQEIKGKKEPVNVYQVIAPSTRRTRFDVSAERGLTPFVGREREVELLLDGFERAKTGRGQAFSIIAEAGVGKSRLLYEFRKILASEDVTFLEGRCLSYSKGVAYHPVIDILKGNFDIQEGDADLEITEKVRNGLKMLGADETSTLPFLLELLSVRDSGIDKIPMSPESRRERIIEALKRIAILGSEIRPLIMAFEDLYWVDKSSEEALKLLLDSIPGLRVLLIFTYRPEFVLTWGAKTYHSQLTLNRLSNRESLAMVMHVLGTENIDGELQELILEKTEGIPFFIEEFVRSLKDLKIVEKEDNRYHLARDIMHVTIPSTIQDVVMSRVDTLPVGAKEVLQTASVIERQFSYPLIMQVTGLPEQELLTSLSFLKDAEVLFERGIYPETEYIFKHALTREVVYSSILAGRRKELHEQIGRCIEETNKQNLDEYFGVLAEHFIAGENFEKGAEYSKLSARKLEKLASMNDAITHAEKGISCLEKLPRTDDLTKELIDARTTLGLYMSQMGYMLQAEQAVEPIVELALKRGYKRRISQIYAITGTYKHMVEEDFQRGIRYLEDGLRISEEIGDIASLFFGHFWLGFALCLSCEFEKAQYHLERAADINMAANSIWGAVLTKCFLGGQVFCMHGQIPLGYRISEDSVRTAKETDDILIKAVAHTAHGMSNYFRGFLQEAKRHFLEGVKFCERSNHVGWSLLAHHHLAETYFEIGEYQESIVHYDKAASLYEQNKMSPSTVNLNRIGMAKAKVMNNEKSVDLDVLCSYVHENKVKRFNGVMSRYIGEIYLNLDDQYLSDADDWLEKAIEADKTNGMMFHVGQDYALYAELFKRKGDQSKAKENLAKAIEIYKDCGADGWVEKAEKDLAELSTSD